MVETLPVPRLSDAPPRPLRLGFAGVGWIGRNRLEAIIASGLAEVSALVDPAAQNLDALAAEFPAAVATRHFEALLQLDLDGIVIATPSALHADQAIAALEHGKAVFCQKPLGRTAAENQRVIVAARAANLLLGVDLSYRWTTGMQRIHELIASGALGEIYAAELVFHHAYGPDKPWFYDRQQAGGGCLLDLGIHLLDLALWSLDYPEVVSAQGHLVCGGRPLHLASRDEVEDYAAGQLRLANGTSLQLACSWHAPAGCDARIELTFFGTRGGASFRNVDGSFYEFIAEHLLADRSRRELASGTEVWGGRAALAWVRQLSSSAAYDPTIEHLATVAAAIDQLYGRNQ